MREQIIKAIEETRVIGIIRGIYGENALKLADALYKGGLRALEVTFNPSAEDNSSTLETIKSIRDKLGDKLFVGAGTVISEEFLDAAIGAGAQFIVSPDVNAKVIKKTVKSGLVSLPGALTPTEILSAHNSGADFVKVFPTANLGAGYIKAVRAPLNHIKLLAIGGVNENNAAEFVAAGACGVGVGCLADKKLIAEGAWEKLTEKTATLIKNVQAAVK